MAELQTRMDSREFAEWIAFDRIEPLPDPWMQTAVSCWAARSVWGKCKVEDFLPRRQPLKPLPVETQKAMLNALAARQLAKFGNQPPVA